LRACGGVQAILGEQQRRGLRGLLDLGPGRRPADLADIRDLLLAPDGVTVAHGEQEALVRTAGEVIEQEIDLGELAPKDEVLHPGVRVPA
jgi:hypothetical protein